MEPKKEQLEELVRQIVEAVHPLKIIVFGSAARGEMGPDSDVDLLVVMPEGTHRGRTARFLYRTVSRHGLSLDFVVVTPEDMAKYQNTPGFIIHEVVVEGKTVYAA